MATGLVGLARELLANGPVPLVVPLQEWSEGTDDVFGWLVKRPAFGSLSAAHLKFLALHGETALLLDGWNEVSQAARSRLLGELKGLKRDYPLQCAVMTTRPQVLDVPLAGQQLEVLPLNRAQQRELAQALKGQQGLALLTRARQTRGLRDLVGIPLYLTVLLKTSTDGHLPETKEAVLRLFVEAHESDPTRAEVLHRELAGQHPTYLTALAVEAHVTSNTSIGVAVASASVGRTSALLVEQHQIHVAPAPVHVLDVLVSTHALQTEGSETFSFQHQQFQEWYASKDVEMQLYNRPPGPFGLDDWFVVERLNHRIWEEAILFACERMSRRDVEGARIVANLVRVCLGVDPMLAAEITRRSDGRVWQDVANDVVAFANRWHTQGEVDRALSFMVASGKSEFADIVWPLVSSENSQVRLPALRSGGRFDMNVLGDRLQPGYAGLSPEARGSLLAEMIHTGGLEELQESVRLAEGEPDAQVKTRAVESLIFEGAVAEAEQLLRLSGDELVGLVARRGYREEIIDQDLQNRFATILRADFDAETDPLRKLSKLWGAVPVEEQPALVESLLSDPALDMKGDAFRRVVDNAEDKFPEAVQNALRLRVERGLPVPWRFEEYLVTIDTTDGGAIRSILLNGELGSDQAKHAAVFAGQELTRELCDRYLEAAKTFRRGGVRTEPAYRPVRQLLDVLECIRSEVLQRVVVSYAVPDDEEVIGDLCELLVQNGRSNRHGTDERLTTQEGPAREVVGLLGRWGRALLDRQGASRHKLSQVAGGMKRYADPSHGEVLGDMLRRDLEVRRELKATFLADRTNQEARQQWSTSHAWTYRDALVAAGGEAASTIFESLLRDEEFGVDAASGLLAIARGPVEKTQTLWRQHPDGALALQNRARRGEDPDATSDTAETLFSAVDDLISGAGAEIVPLERAAQMASMALSVPHGDKQSVLDALLSAATRTRSRLALMIQMADSGYVLSADQLLAGLEQLFGAAQKEPWLLGDDKYVVRDWLRLFAFSDRPLALMDAMDRVPVKARPAAWSLRDVISTVRYAAEGDRWALIRGLLEKAPELVNEHSTYDAALSLPLDDFLAFLEQVFEAPGRKQGLAATGWDYAAKVAARLSPDEIAGLKVRLSVRQAGPMAFFVADLLAALEEPSLFLFLASLEVGRKSLKRRRAISLRNLTSARAPSSDGDSDEYIPADRTDFRKGLFDLTLSGDSRTQEFAADSLADFDDARDEYGQVESEPRHPDIASGRPWPSAARTETTDAAEATQSGDARALV